MKLLWGLLNTLQLISFLPLISLETPSIMSIFFQKINFLNMDFYKVDDYIREKYQFVRVYYSWTENFSFAQKF